MNKTQTSNVLSFADRYNSLPANQQTAFRTEIMKATGWTNSTFYRKMKKPESVRRLEQIIIAEIFNVSPEQIF